MPDGNNAELTPKKPAADSSPAGGSVNKIDLKYLAGVAGAGAVGGLLYWVLAHFSGTTIHGFGPLAAAFALMFVGAIAAAIGVYLLTASDPTAIRTYVFAVLCGLMWQPVIESGERIVTNAVATSQDNTVQQALPSLQSAATSGDVNQINTAVQQTVPAVTQALNASPALSDTDKKSQIATTSKTAIDLLQKTAAKAPDTSIDGLKTIALTASSSSQTSVGVSAVQSLHEIGDDAERTHNEKVLQSVRKSLVAVADEAKDPTVQKSAAFSAKQLSAPK